jgi:predicted alpha/beta superfamily hydrolase
MNRRDTLALMGGVALQGGARAQARARTVGDRLQVLPPLPLPALNRERTVRVYLPPSYATQPQRRYPVVYLQDGQNLFDEATSYAGEWGVDETLDALAAQTGFEAIAVGIDHGAEHRLQELNPWDQPRFGLGQGEAYLAFVADTVKPHIDQSFRTLPGRAHTVLGGSSMGGLISLAGLCLHRGTFGRGLVMSPSLWIAPQAFELLQKQPLPADTRVYVYAGGREDRDMVAHAERVHRLIAPPAVATLRVNESGQHNEATWRAELPAALRFVFDLPA